MTQTATLEAMAEMGEPAARPKDAASTRPATSTTFIASPWYDFVWFLSPPALAIALGAVLGITGAGDRRFWLDGHRVTYGGLALGALINAHLVAVLFRSHANKQIFRRHPVRFVIVPPLLVAAIALSEPVMILTTIVVVFWDVYHSAMQTFGFARIYDRRAGNDPTVGRRLDLALNLVMYIGPIVAGATMLAYADKLTSFEDIGIYLFSSVPAALEERARLIVFGVLGLGVAFIAFYVAAYVRLARRGYRVAWPKVWLLSSTGVCSIVAWGFNPWGLAFFIMNFFHGVQYLALVWWSEAPRIRALFQARKLAPAGFLALVFSYGLWADGVGNDEPWLWAVTQTVALMHFWYDGFVWSVTKRHV